MTGKRLEGKVERSGTVGQPRNNVGARASY